MSALAQELVLGDVRLPERFWSKVNRVPCGCWIWTGCVGEDGYGRIAFEGRTQVAHRVSYAALVGPIPDGLVLDHLCRNRACCNPEHLEPVTNAENILRGIGPSAQHAMKTRCPAGHPYTPENTYLYRGMRYCVTCKSAHTQRGKAKAAAELAGNAADPRHGTVQGYASYRCRCDRCRLAWRDYMRQRRAGASS